MSLVVQGTHAAARSTMPRDIGRGCSHEYEYPRKQRGSGKQSKVPWTRNEPKDAHDQSDKPEQFSRRSFRSQDLPQRQERQQAPKDATSYRRTVRGAFRCSRTDGDVSGHGFRLVTCSVPVAVTIRVVFQRAFPASSAASSACASARPSIFKIRYSTRSPHFLRRRPGRASGRSISRTPPPPAARLSR